MTEVFITCVVCRTEFDGEVGDDDKCPNCGKPYQWEEGIVDWGDPDA